MATESTLQAAFCKLARSNGILVYKFASPSQRGVPDLMCIYDGFVCFVEMKSPNKTGRLTQMQLYQIEQIEDHGVNCFVSDSKESNEGLVELILLVTHPE